MVKKRKVRTRVPLRLKPAPQLSQEQQLLSEMFGGNEMWGTGKNLPELKGALIEGRGLMDSGDYESETASMFGFKRKRIQDERT